MAKEQEVFKHVPYDIEVEQSILGSILVDPRHLEKLPVSFKAEHFYDILHQRLFQHMRDLNARGAAITPLTIHADLKADPSMVEVGGLAYLAGLAEASPALPNVTGYSRILLELHTRRELIRLGEDIVNLAHTPTFETPVNEQVKLAERAIETVSSVWRQDGSGRLPERAGDVAMRVMQRTADMRKGGKPLLVPTGFRYVDNIIGGMGPGELIIIPGRSGMGKSAFLSALSINAARAGYPAFIASIEMANTGYAERQICDVDYYTYKGRYENPLQYEQFRTGNMTDVEFERGVLAAQEIAQWPLELCDEEELTLSAIEARARAFQRKFPPGTLGLILVDYLQIVEPTRRREGTREQEVNEIARGLKKMAKRLGWPVVAASQVKRAVDDRNDKKLRPTLADIRESGAIENEADLIMFPFRKAHYIYKDKPEIGSPETSFAAWQMEYRDWKHVLEILCRKNRGGREFDLSLWCDIASSAIRDREPGKLEVEQAQSDLALQF